MYKLRVYFSGDDLWEWTKIKDGYDPENGEGGNTTFPFSRMEVPLRTLIVYSLLSVSYSVII